MQYVAKNGLLDRVGRLGVLLVVSAMGCTQASKQTTEHAAAPSSREASQTAAAPAATTPSPSADVGDGATRSAAEDLRPAARPGGNAEAAGGQAHVVGKPVVSEYAPGVPQVLLSSGHSELCKVGVGEVLPTMELAKIGGGKASLESLAGAKATVLLFWTADRWMSETALRELTKLAANKDVSLVGIAVGVPADAAGKMLAKTGAKFTQLLDADGGALAQLGKDGLPRIYVLDGQRRIAWFDIEFSESTRRELGQTLAALAGDGAK